MQIVLVPRGCPVCRSDVRGSPKALYLCKPCNALFHKEAVRWPKPKPGAAKARVRALLKGFEKPAKKAPVLVIAPEPVEEPDAYSWKRDWKQGFIVSLKSKRFHKPSCKYIQNIKRNNLAFFKSEEEAARKGFGRCRCLRIPKKKKWPLAKHKA